MGYIDHPHPRTYGLPIGAKQIMVKTIRARPTRVVPGFTIVELLVVIGIIGVLVALLLPAVQYARATARRMSCGNNLKQVSLAFHAYHDALGSFPPASVRAPYDVPYGFYGKPGWGWGALILPFVEQEALHDQLGVLTRNLDDSEDLIPLTQTKLEIYLCPSSPAPLLNPSFRDVAFPEKDVPATSNYKAMFGSANIAESGSVVPGCPTSNFSRGHCFGGETGIFGAGSANRMQDVTDGTSNTIAIGETTYGDIGDGVARMASVWTGISPEGTGGYPPKDRPMRVVMHSLANEPRWRINGTFKNAFSSHHPGGAQFGFADGSVRFLSETMDGVVAEHMADRADGFAIE